MISAVKFALFVALLVGLITAQTCPCRANTAGTCNFIFNFPDGSTQPGFEGQPTCGTANTACSGCVCVPDSEADFTCQITENVPMWRLFDGGYGNACRLESFTLATCPPL
mmetsp:Transcript_14754/g.37638  ORF Transcript_14754/g.37638 Transcript_14754/m.37638 type:complete len:110 (+) Transcript_14754:144-473(+)